MDQANFFVFPYKSAVHCCSHLLEEFFFATRGKTLCPETAAQSMACALLPFCLKPLYELLDSFFSQHLTMLRNKGFPFVWKQHWKNKDSPNRTIYLQIYRPLFHKPDIRFTSKKTSSPSIAKMSTTFSVTMLMSLCKHSRRRACDRIVISHWQENSMPRSCTSLNLHVSANWNSRTGFLIFADTYACGHMDTALLGCLGASLQTHVPVQGAGEGGLCETGIIWRKTRRQWRYDGAVSRNWKRNDRSLASAWKGIYNIS